MFITSSNFTNLKKGFYINGTSSYPIGHLNTIATGGDINCDGYTDIVLASPNATSNLGLSVNAVNAGEVFVVFGGNNITNINLDNFSAYRGSRIQSLSPGMNLGLAVTTNSDLNNDGCNDIAVSSQQGIHVIYGSNSFPESLVVELAPTSAVSVITSSLGASEWCSYLSSGGDFNGDGIDDITTTGTNASYVIFGTQTKFPKNIELGNIKFWGKIFPNNVPIALSRRDHGLTSQNFLSQSLNGFRFCGDINGDDKADLSFENNMFSYQLNTYSGSLNYSGYTPYNMVQTYSGNVQDSGSTTCIGYRGYPCTQSYSVSVPYSGSALCSGSALYNGVISYNNSISSTLFQQGIAVSTSYESSPLTYSIIKNNPPSILQSYNIEQARYSNFNPYILAEGKGDLNNDGIDDLVCAVGNNVQVLYGVKDTAQILNPGKGYTISFPQDISIKSLSLGKDFNGDSIDDMVVNLNSVYNYGSMVVYGSNNQTDINNPFANSTNTNIEPLIFDHHSIGAQNTKNILLTTGINHPGQSALVIADPYQNDGGQVAILYGAISNLITPNPTSATIPTNMTQSEACSSSSEWEVESFLTGLGIGIGAAVIIGAAALYYCYSRKSGLFTPSPGDHANTPAFNNPVYIMGAGQEPHHYGAYDGSLHEYESVSTYNRYNHLAARNNVIGSTDMDV